MKPVILFCLLIIVVMFTFSGCRVQQNDGKQDDFANGRYDSEFPSSSISESLDMISGSVKKLDCLAFYSTYTFDVADRITRGQLSGKSLETISSGMVITNESVSGTATIVYHKNNLVGLITCAHVIDFPDSLFIWSGEHTGILTAVSVLIKQQNYITGLPEGEPVEVVVMNKEKDIALLSRIVSSNQPRVQVLNYPIGNTSLFEWGSVVYIVGYPIGNLMVTRALVSNPKKTKNGVFITDALFNHGISGSPVFAIKDGVPNLEWVGMAFSTSASDMMVVRPEQGSEKLPPGNYPYQGNLYLEKIKFINYGVTYSIAIEEIVTFIHQNQSQLKRAGFDFEDYFIKP